MKYKLGQRVKFNAYVYKSKGAYDTEWIRLEPLSSEPHEGIVVGKRTVAEGTTGWFQDEGATFRASKYIPVYLVATNLCTTRRVMAEDLEPIEDAIIE